MFMGIPRASGVWLVAILFGKRLIGTSGLADLERNQSRCIRESWVR
jgi:hypothetical protein